MFYERWTRVVKQSVTLVSGGVEGWRDGAGWDGMAVGRWQYHHHDCSRHTLVTEHRPVTSSQQPNDKDASPSGAVISGLTAPLFPSLNPPPPARTHTHTGTPLFL